MSLSNSIRRALFVFLFGAAFLVVGLLLGHSRREASVYTTEEADIVVVHGRHAVVMLKGDYLAKLFTPEWQRCQFYERHREVVGEDGIPARASGPWYVAADATALRFSDTQWMEINCYLYCPEIPRHVLLSVNLQAGRVSAQEQPLPNQSPRYNPDIRGLRFSD